ncbi:MAG: hypothetical protein R3E65_09495 [Steroidobacteraceae bacterium]
MTERDSVLEVGTGSGYLTAAMALQCARVRSARSARGFRRCGARATSLGLGAVEVAAADAFAAGALGSGSWDAVVLTGSLPTYDPRFEQRLAVGGRLFVVLGRAPVMQATLVRRISSTEWARQVLFETVIDPLVGAPAAPAFLF